MRAVLGVLFAFVLVIGFSVTVSALSCRVTSVDCPSGEIPIFKMSSQSNAHAELVNQNNYNYAVCCSAGVNLRNSCSDPKQATVLWLSAQTNAHASQTSSSSYGTQVCLSSINPSVQQIECNFKSDSCDSGYQCLASMSASTNAHVGNCSAYNIKICCKADEYATPPNVSVVADPSSVLTSWQSTDATAAVGCSSDNPNVPCDTTSYRLKVSNTQLTCPDYSEPGYPITTPLPYTIDSNKWVCAGALNTAGIKGNSSPVEFKIDKTAPTEGSLSYADGYHTSSSITVNVAQGSDPVPVSGIKELRIYAKDATLQNGACGTFSQDWTQMGSTQSPGATSIQVDVSTDRCYNFSLGVKNNAGLETQYYSTSIVKADSTLPVTTDNSQPGWVGNNYRMQLTPLDAGSGVAHTYFCIYRVDDHLEPECNPTTYEGTGFTLSCSDATCKYRARYYSVDRAGNTESVHNSTNVFQVDNSKPSCTMSNLAEFLNSNSIQLSWNGSDPATNSSAGVDNYTIYYYFGPTNSGPWTAITTIPATSYTFAAGNDGKYWFYCIARSARAEGYASAYAYTTIDTVPPSVTITGFPLWENETSFAVSWQGSDALSGISTYFVEYKDTNEGVVVRDWTSLGHVEKPETAIPFTGAANNHTYFFRVKANDSAGNMGSFLEVRNVTMDFDLPTCSLSNLPTWVNGSGSLTVSWSGEDIGSGISYYTIQKNKNSGSWVSFNNSNRTQSTSITITLEDGFNYYFRCMATDTALNSGNWSEIKSTTADLTRPALSIEYKPEVSSGEDQVVNVTASDDISGVASLNLTLGGALRSPANQTGTGTQKQATWVLSSLAIGSYSFNISSSDAAGNANITMVSFVVLTCVEGHNRTCGSNIGECSSGNQTCINGQWGNCTGNVIPATEACDSKDNDCDGLVDNAHGTNQSLTQSCGDSNIGRCRLGTQTCTSGFWGSCQGAVLATDSEVCGNSLDDNCNGRTDEGCMCTPGTTQPCGDSNVPPCKFGTQTCSADGKLSDTCAGAIYPSASEICGNGIDDDCNSVVDDGCEEEPTTPVSSDLSWILILAGVIVLIVLALLWFSFKRKGKELTWEELSKRWTTSKY